MVPLVASLDWHLALIFSICTKRFYLDVKGRYLDTEKPFAYRAVPRSFLLT